MSRPSRVLARELAALGLDLHGTLADEARFLTDSTFLGALHLELREQLGPEDARSALHQLGFLHGLRDALALVEGGLASAWQDAGTLPMHAKLPLRLARWSSGVSVDVRGTWPERREADAVARTLGAVGHASCHLSCGYTAGWLSGVFDAEVFTSETACEAAGDDACVFAGREIAAWPAGDDAERAAEFPFAPLRELVERHLAAQPAPRRSDRERFERGSPVIHVWGPVMVIPFAGPEESLRALDLIGRDPGARNVRVVVIDLDGAIIDEGFGAAALEQVIAAVEGWGAEPILTGVSPLSEPIVAGLQHSHLVVRKDLPEAIAAAFQIADVQRRGI